MYMRGVDFFFAVVILVGGANVRLAAEFAEGEITGEDFLVVAAGNMNGSGKVWYKPLHAGTTVIDLPGALTSSCGLFYPSKCRTLVVNSTHLDANVTSQDVFLPLENEFHVLKITHNGSALGSSKYTSFESFPTMQQGRGCPVNCTSVGVFKIRVHYYTLCATPTKICICELRSSTIDSNEYLITNCHQYEVGIAGILDQMSNIVSSSNSRQPYLYFFVRNALFRLNPVDRIVSYLDEVSRHLRQCSFVDQLTLEENILFIYCANNVSAVYNLNIGRLLAFGRERHYQCSSSTNITVSLGMENETSNLTYVSHAGALNIPLPREVSFVYGMCFMLQQHSIFLYLDRRDGIILFNGTVAEFTHINHSRACEEREGGCQWPLVLNNRYLVAKDHMQDTLTVYDMEQNFSSAIINLNQVPYRAIAVIDNLQISCPIQSILPTTSVLSTSLVPTPSPVITSVAPTINTSSITMFSSQVLSPSSLAFSPSPDIPPIGSEFELTGTVAFVTAIAMTIIILLLIAIGCILYFNSKLKRSRNHDSLDGDYDSEPSSFMNTTHEHQANTIVPEAEADNTTGPNNCRQPVLGLSLSAPALSCQVSTGSMSVTCTPHSEQGPAQIGSTPL